MSSRPAPGEKPSPGWWIGRLECAGSVERSSPWVSTAHRHRFPPPAARRRCGEAPCRLRITTGLNAVQAMQGIGQTHHEVSTHDQIQASSWSQTLALPFARRTSPSSMSPTSQPRRMAGAQESGCPVCARAWSREASLADRGRSLRRQDPRADHAEGSTFDLTGRVVPPAVAIAVDVRTVAVTIGLGTGPILKAKRGAVRPLPAPRP